MADAERGPSYRDVDTYLDEMRKTRGVGTRFHIAPPIATIDGRGRSGWGVTIEVWALRAKAPKTWYGAARFGHAGSWKTLPAAMLAAARAVEAQWADEERAALAQQRF